MKISAAKAMLIICAHRRMVPKAHGRKVRWMRTRLIRTRSAGCRDTLLAEPDDNRGLDGWREVSTVSECGVDDGSGKPDRMKPRGEAG